MSTSSAIEASDLVVDHATQSGVVRALSCDRLVVPHGTSLAVMGTSGCGKSTLLGLLAGLATPTSGTIRIGDSTITAMSEAERVALRRREIGMVYQADNLLPFLTVSENVSLPLAISQRASNTGELWGGPSELLDRLGMADLADRLPDQLSGGQRQRAAVARAVVREPAVILADEPTGSLDEDSAGAVVDLLVSVQRRLAATMVVVTHDPDVAAAMDRTVHLERSAPTTEHADAH